MINRKIKSESGATMIMALLLLLVAITCSAVIISSAMTSAANVKGTEKDQQAYLSVSSAAEYIKSEICKGKIDRTHNIDGTFTDTVDTASAFKPEIEKCINVLSGRIEKEIIGTKVFVKNSVYSDDPFYININADNTKLLPVEVKFEMDKAYDIIVHLSISDENYSEYKTKLYFTSVFEKKDASHDTIKWPNCYVSREDG